MIELNAVGRILDEALNIVDDLNGQQLDERKAVSSQSKGEVRKRNAEMSKELNYLADQLTLAAALVRNQYWAARGNPDHLGAKNCF